MGSEITTDECEAERQHILMNNQLTEQYLFSSGIQFHFLNEEQTTSAVCLYRRPIVRNPAEKGSEGKASALK